MWDGVRVESVLIRLALSVPLAGGSWFRAETIRAMEERMNLYHGRFRSYTTGGVVSRWER
jgi:hypothetical protein